MRQYRELVVRRQDRHDEFTQVFGCATASALLVNWLGIGILWLIVQLPYPVLYKLGCALGRLALRLMKRRAKIVSRNLELCFPQMSEQERQQMMVKTLSLSVWA